MLEIPFSVETLLIPLRIILLGWYIGFGVGFIYVALYIT